MRGTIPRMEGSTLFQQELLEAPPARRLIVPHGHTAHWGVDPSTTRVALSGVLRRPDGSLDRWVRLVPFGALEGAQRLSVIREDVRQLVTMVAEDHMEASFLPLPGIVFVEQPSGKRENPALSYAVGVTIEAVYDGLREVTNVPVHIETVTSSAWKKAACGYGAIYKPKRKSDAEYGVLTWAKANGYAGTSWDEADAMGIAEAARRTVALEER